MARNLNSPSNIIAIRNPNPPAEGPTHDALGKEITRQCTAKSIKSGLRCKKSAMLGQRVCRAHGGAAPQAKASARLRLAQLVEPAIATLAREMATADKSNDRQRAANSLLDRAGVTRGASTEAEALKLLLLERLLSMKEQDDKRGR